MRISNGAAWNSIVVQHQPFFFPPSKDQKMNGHQAIPNVFGLVEPRMKRRWSCQSYRTGFFRKGQIANTPRHLVATNGALNLDWGQRNCQAEIGSILRLESYVLGTSRFAETCRAAKRAVRTWYNPRASGG